MRGGILFVKYQIMFPAPPPKTDEFPSLVDRWLSVAVRSDMKVMPLSQSIIVIGWQKLIVHGLQYDP